MSSLFSAAPLGSLHLANRILMAPMTRSRAVQDNAANALHEEYYAQRASAGLIVTEGVAPSANGLGYARTPAIATPAQVQAWSRVTAAVHAKGGQIAIQLMHVGRIAHPANQPAGARIVAPSAVAAQTSMWTDTQGMQPLPVPAALTSEEIQGVIAEFVQATRNAREAGFDAIEIHGANGYLVNQFLAPNTNQRTDGYGGSPDRRIRFAVELWEAMAAAWEPGRIGIRVSPGGAFNDIADPEAASTYPLLADALSSRQAAFLHVVKADSPHFTQWEALRDAFPGRFILNNGLTLASGSAAIASGAADFVAYGRPFISNPDLVERFQQNLPLAPADPATFYTPGPEGFIDYPRA